MLAASTFHGHTVSRVQRSVLGDTYTQASLAQPGLARLTAGDGPSDLNKTTFVFLQSRGGLVHVSLGTYQKRLTQRRAAAVVGGGIQDGKIVEVGEAIRGQGEIRGVFHAA